MTRRFRPGDRVRYKEAYLVEHPELRNKSNGERTVAGVASPVVRFMEGSWNHEHTLELLSDRSPFETDLQDYINAEFRELGL